MSSPDPDKPLMAQRFRGFFPVIVDVETGGSDEKKDALLDIVATPDRNSYKQGENLGFEVEIFNMGSADRFDIPLDYRLLDENDNKILGREKTIAISTNPIKTVFLDINLV